ncbi:abhydrolase domain-containing 18 [Spongiibacter sp. KMU-158]|uniref:Abhydrolase domain-containing 18 n=1 Tax=Spongiibacter pelagi TaxID=2760804 RepID=A0A927C0U9_9GAMM|nr:abhydrolase domain-containing 18 [Spongiibacter pelagi]MBD2857817.1 abhydrolase domain-containing 18 [Spongiibacter pelagi]
MKPQPQVKQQPPWWVSLPEDFYCQSDGTELDSEYPLQVYGTAVVDKVVRTALATMFAAAALPRFRNSANIDRDRLAMEFYSKLANDRDVDKVFVKPPEVEVKAVQPPAMSYKPRGIPAFNLSFKSPYEPLYTPIADDFLSNRRNLTAHAQYWTHPDGPRPTLIFVHGVVGSWYAFNAPFFNLREFYNQGYDILLYIQPFHGPRKEKTHPFNGYGLFGSGFAQMNEAMLQAIMELRVLVDYLLKRGSPCVGISGLSLGGYLSSLMAVVESRLAFCIPNSPLVAPVDTMRSWWPSGELINWMAKHTEMDALELRKGLAIHSPLSYQPKLDPEKVMIIGGAGDRFTPPRFVRLLHDHWPGSHLHWFPGNHIVHLGQEEYLRLMKQFMDSHCQHSLS